jgi:2-keto-3-deoxy-galactonokinase
MLIGSEIAASLRGAETAPRAIIGAPALAARYQRALVLAGHEAPILDAETATVRGLLAIAGRR